MKDFIISVLILASIFAIYAMVLRWSIEGIFGIRSELHYYLGLVLMFNLMAGSGRE